VRPAVNAAAVEGALAQRLRTVLPFLTGEEPPFSKGPPATEAGELLDRLVTAVLEVPTEDRVWLLCTAVAGLLPTSDDVVSGVRFFRLASAIEAAKWLLAYALESARTRTAHAELRVVANSVVIDVDGTASGGHGGVPSDVEDVVANLLPVWMRDHEISPVCWTHGAEAMRAPSRRERVWLIERRDGGAGRAPEGEAASEPFLVVPWRSVVVLPEVCEQRASERLVALARHSGNSVVVVAYDCAAVISADLVPADATNRLAKFLTVVKHSKRVACVGATAVAELEGFVSALAPQGMTGPVVEEVPLPIASADDAARRKPSARPIVLAAGPIEERTNLLGVLYASECLWREGLAFELVLLGDTLGGEEAGATKKPRREDQVLRRVEKLRAAGRPVTTVLDPTRSESDAAYGRARFAVFVSLHDGPALPLLRALGHATPVITSDFGTMAEIGREGGAVLVDPGDDEALVSAMRRLLDDDDDVRRLEGEIRARRSGTWESYGTDLWGVLVEPELRGLTSMAETA
jgi:glycosyltransferase involved in cell wall biosynthesis